MVPTPWNCALEPVMASQSKPVAWKSMGPLGSTAAPWHGVGATGAAAAGVGAGVAGTAGLAGVSVVPGVSVVVGADPLPVVDAAGSKTTNGTDAVVELKLPPTLDSIRYTPAGGAVIDVELVPSATTGVVLCATTLPLPSLIANDIWAVVMSPGASSLSWVTLAARWMGPLVDTMVSPV